jgi:hypothetical protein
LDPRENAVAIQIEAVAIQIEVVAKGHDFSRAGNIAK